VVHRCRLMGPLPSEKGVAKNIVVDRIWPQLIYLCWNDSRLENCSSQGQDLALTVLSVLNSLQSGAPESGCLLTGRWGVQGLKKILSGKKMHPPMTQP